MTPQEQLIVRYEGRLEQLDNDRPFMNSSHYWKEKRNLESLVGIIKEIKEV